MVVGVVNIPVRVQMIVGLRMTVMVVGINHISYLHSFLRSSLISELPFISLYMVDYILYKTA